jgi:hypothetical protein
VAGVLPDNEVIEKNEVVAGRFLDERDQQLSERRARSMVDYLVSRGVDLTRIVGRGNGPASPSPQRHPPRAGRRTGGRMTATSPRPQDFSSLPVLL